MAHYVIPADVQVSHVRAAGELYLVQQFCLPEWLSLRVPVDLRLACIVMLLRLDWMESLVTVLLPPSIPVPIAAAWSNLPRASQINLRCPSMVPRPCTPERKSFNEDPTPKASTFGPRASFLLAETRNNPMPAQGIHRIYHWLYHHGT